VSDNPNNLPIKAEAKPVRRGEGGKFVKGTAPGPGCREGGKIAQVRAILFDNMTVPDWEAIRTALVEQAKQGSVKHMALLFSYVLGKPVQQLDLNMTAAQITPEEAQKRMRAFFGMD
jgi:hypothetical protein